MKCFNCTYESRDNLRFPKCPGCGYEQHIPNIPESITRRDFFAGLALHGILSTVTMGREEYMTFIVPSAVEYANALIEELDKKK